MIKIQEGDFLVDTEVRNLRSQFSNTGGGGTFIGTAGGASKGKQIKEFFFVNFELKFRIISILESPIQLKLKLLR